MRLATAFIVCVGFVAGCDRSAPLTPAQKQQVDAARAATVATSERLLGRALTDAEKDCIHVDFEDGRPVGSVAAPLSETLKRRQAELSGPANAASTPMSAPAGMSKYPYLAADGGPHLLLPAEAARTWTGAPSMLAAANPKSDYGRACAATASAQMGAIAVGSTSALVFADPPMTAWGTSADGCVEVYYLKSWAGMNLDALIAKATAALPTASLTSTGAVLQLHEPDAFLLFAGDTPTSTAYGVHRVNLPAGKYNVLVGTYTAQGESVTVYRLQPAGK